MNDNEILEKYADAKFIGVIKVGARGVPNVYTDKDKYERAYDKAWDSGWDLETRILRQ